MTYGAIGFGTFLIVVGLSVLVPQIVAAGRGRTDLAIEWAFGGGALVGAGAALVAVGVG